MANIVDRQQRRQEILEGFLDYIATVGLNDATSRGLGHHIGRSSGSLWNYFENFDELIVEGFRASFVAQLERLDSVNRSPGLLGLASVFADLLPIADESRYEGKIALGFLTNLGRHEELAVIQSQTERKWADHIRHHLQAMDEQQLLRHAIDVNRVTEILLVTVVGLQMQWALPNSVNSSPERQWQILTDAITPWLESGVEFLDLSHVRRLVSARG